MVDYDLLLLLFAKRLCWGFCTLAIMVVVGCIVDALVSVKR